MKSVGKTYNNKLQIGRMFPQGREAKEIWYQGDCIFKLGGRFTITESEHLGHMIECSDYICCIHGCDEDGFFRASRFKNGKYLDEFTYLTRYQDGFRGIHVAHHSHGLVLISGYNSVKKEMSEHFYVFDGEVMHYFTLGNELTTFLVEQGYSYVDGCFIKDELVIGHWFQHAFLQGNLPDAKVPKEVWENDGWFRWHNYYASIVFTGKTPVGYRFEHTTCFDYNSESPTKSDYNPSITSTYKFGNPLIFQVWYDPVTEKAYADAATHIQPISTTEFMLLRGVFDYNGGTAVNGEITEKDWFYTTTETANRWSNCIVSNSNTGKIGNIALLKENVFVGRIEVQGDVYQRSVPFVTQIGLSNFMWFLQDGNYSDRVTNGKEYRYRKLNGGFVRSFSPPIDKANLGVSYDWHDNYTVYNSCVLDGMVYGYDAQTETYYSVNPEDRSLYDVIEPPNYGAFNNIMVTKNPVDTSATSLEDYLYGVGIYELEEDSGFTKDEFNLARITWGSTAYNSDGIYCYAGNKLGYFSFSEATEEDEE